MFTISNDDALNLLTDRVKYWTDDETAICLFEKNV